MTHEGTTDLVDTFAMNTLAVALLGCCLTPDCPRRSPPSWSTPTSA